MAEYPAHLDEKRWSQDGIVTNQSGDKVVAGSKMTEYYTNLKKMVVAEFKNQCI
jgi:hypothetical protein